MKPRIKKAILRELLTKLVACLPKNKQSDYYDELAKIIPPRKAWSDQAKELQKGPEIKVNTDNPERKEDNPDNLKIKGDHDFYFIEKDKEGQFRDIRIDRVKLINKLKELGFYRFDIDANNNRFVKIINNTITEVSTTLITDQFISFIDELAGYQHKWEGGSKFIDNIIIKRKVYNGLDTYFSGPY